MSHETIQKSKEIERKYSQQKISINKNDWVFMYTDGYVDQLGGSQMRSLGMNHFLETIQESVLVKNKNREEGFKQVCCRGCGVYFSLA